MTQATQPQTSPPADTGPSGAVIVALGGTALLALAAYHRQRQQALSAMASRYLRTLWRYIDPRRPQESWGAVSARANLAMATAQAEAARGATDYVTAALRMQGVEPEPSGVVISTAFAGTAADGRALETLLSYPAFEVSAFVDQGMAPEQAAAIGGRHLERIAASEISDAARVSTGVAAVSDRRTRGYVRMLTPPSCSRCVILAGRWYRWNAGFQRHPQCFPAGTVVSGPGADGAARRWYQGELVVIRTAGGKNLAVTANHPILTSQGWLPAHLLHEGGDVISRASGDRSGSLLVPDHDQMPTAIEDLWRSSAMGPLGRMPVAAEDFHGDGFGSSHVDVVLADRLLRDWQEVAALQELSEEQLAFGTEPAVPFPDGGTNAQLRLGDLPQMRGIIGRLRLGGSLRLRHLARTNDPSFAWSANGYTGIHEPLSDHGSTYAEAHRHRALALTSEIGRDYGRYINVAVTPRWDAPAASFSVESRMAYASCGNDLRFRLAGKVQVDRVVELRRIEWSGHVYNLTSREGWYDANGFIVSNCDCVHIPAAEDVEDDVRTSAKGYFDDLSEADQDRTFTRAGAQAVRDGADLARVVNARRGMYTAGGRKLTHEATTRRGTGRRIRLMPEQIYIEAKGNRDEAIRLLKLHGYIR